MAYEQVKRNNFNDPDPTKLATHISKYHSDDLQNYHIPLERMHHSNLHDWGIARGLEVSGTLDRTEIVVKAGVAIDRDGQLISLSSKADIGENPPEGESNEVIVDVHISTQNYAGKTVYVTIQFFEKLRDNDGVLGSWEQVPWVRLQPVEAYDGKSIVLAIAVFKEAGKLAELKTMDNTLPHRRHLIGECIEELRIKRSSKIGNEVRDIPSGKIGPIDKGGLKITVPDAQDSILFASEKDGNLSNFSNLEVRADVGIGASEPGTALNVSKTNTDAIIRAQTMNSGNSLISLLNNGNQEYQIVANRASSRLEITSPNTVGAMIVFDSSNGNIGIGTIDKPDGKLDVKGDIRAGNSDIYFTKVDHNHTEIGNTSGYAAIENAANFDALMILGRAGTQKGRYVRLWDYLQVNGGMDVTGNVSIGKTNPADKLDVNGSAYFGTGENNQNHKIVIRGPNFPNSSQSFQDLSYEFTAAGSAKVRAFRGESWDTYLQFLTNPVTAGKDDPQVRMHIDGDGNVGIGPTDIKRTLHVEGSEIHSGGPSGGFSFANRRTRNFVESPSRGERWVWYSQSPRPVPPHHLPLRPGIARLWSGRDLLSIDINGNVNAASFTPPSDSRLKSDIKPLTDVLDKLEKIRGVSFKWNELDPYGRSEGGREIGLIAQEVEEVFPELITICGDEGYRGIDYNRFTGVLLEAIKELLESIKELKAENEESKGKIKALEDKVLRSGISNP